MRRRPVLSCASSRMGVFRAVGRRVSSGGCFESMGRAATQRSWSFGSQVSSPTTTVRRTQHLRPFHCFGKEDRECRVRVFLIRVSITTPFSTTRDVGNSETGGHWDVLPPARAVSRIRYLYGQGREMRCRRVQRIRVPLLALLSAKYLLYPYIV